MPWSFFEKLYLFCTGLVEFKNGVLLSCLSFMKLFKDKKNVESLFLSIKIFLVLLKYIN